MKEIASFTVNHLKLLRGIYVSRKDQCGDTWLTTFDLRLKEPNREPVMNTAELHTIEHIGATFLRNDPEMMDQIVYFGPMGCRTGCYLIMKGNLESTDVVDLVTRMFRFIETYEGVIPGAAAEHCGNYLDMNLPMARYEAHRYVTEILEHLTDENLNYPE